MNLTFRHMPQHYASSCVHGTKTRLRVTSLHGYVIYGLREGLQSSLFFGCGVGYYLWT